MKSQSTSNQKTKQSYWEQQIINWNKSGLSQKQYCQSHSLALSTFCYWKKKFRKSTDKSPKFYPLAISSSIPNSTDAGLDLFIGPKKIRVEIKKNFSPATLKRLITTLEQL